MKKPKKVHPPLFHRAAGSIKLTPEGFVGHKPLCDGLHSFLQTETGQAMLEALHNNTPMINHAVDISPAHAALKLGVVNGYLSALACIETMAGIKFEQKPEIKTDWKTKPGPED